MAHTRRRVVFPFTWAAIGTALMTSPLSAQPAFFTGLGDLPGGAHFSQVFDLSADGTAAVGRSISAPTQPQGSTFEAFRWTAATGIVGLGDSNGGDINSEGFGVSADGGIVVGVAEPLGAARWTSSNGWAALPGPLQGGITAFYPRDVSADASVVVGFAATANGNVAARWTMATGVENLGALPNDLGFADAYLSAVSADGAAATGNSFGIEGVHPLHWSASNGLVGLGDVPGGAFYALGNDISADGSTIVGNARTEFASTDEAFIWRADTGFVLPDAGHGASFSGTAYGASGDGSVVVGHFGGVSDGAMIWDAANGMRSIREILVSDFGLDLTGWSLGTAVSVSIDGSVIVGNGVNPQGNPEAWIARIPRGSDVPTTSDWGLVILALLVLTAGSAALRGMRM